MLVPRGGASDLGPSSRCITGPSVRSCRASGILVLIVAMDFRHHFARAALARLLHRRLLGLRNARSLASSREHQNNVLERPYREVVRMEVV